MRYLYFISAVEQSGPPPQKLMEAIGKLSMSERQAGRLIMDGGLMPLNMGARVELRAGKIRVLDGPFAESKEVIGGFAIFEFATRDEALRAAVEFMELHRLHAGDWQGVCEMRPMVG